MAKNRYVNTHFWNDNYIIDLDPIEKLLFLYLLTNPMTDICGIYELPLKKISFETGVDKDMVFKIFDRFENDNKAKYDNGWIALKKFITHQKLNPNIEKGIWAGFQKAPGALVKWVLGKPLKAFESLDAALNYLNLNLNSNNNSNSNDKEKKVTFKKPTIDEINNFLKELNSSEDAERIYYFYESKGWMVGKNKMKDWKASVRGWAKRSKPEEKLSIDERLDKYEKLKNKIEAEK